MSAGCRRLTPGRLHLRWQVDGDLGCLLIPTARRNAREDGLWRHTCFEAFIRPAAAAPGYLEVNASPSLAWATYRFSDYRAEQRDAADAPLENLRVHREAWRLLLEAELAFDPGPAPRVGLAAVLEEPSGTLSHWALAHAPGKADFHRREGFVLQLPVDRGGA